MLKLKKEAFMDKFRWGVIGTGMMAKIACREITASGKHEVVAVYSRTYEKARKFSQKYGAKCYADISGFLSDGNIDAVYIATPHSSHYEYMKLCINASKPVLAEKAFTVNAAQAKAVADLSTQKGVFACEAMWTRFQPVVLQVREWIKEGRIGDITSFTGGFATPAIPFKAILSDRLFKPEYAGGALLDVGIYPLSFSHMLLGIPEKIKCDMKIKDGTDVSEEIVLTYKKAECRLFGTFEGLRSFKGVIQGEKGRIVMPNYTRPTRAYLYDQSGKKIKTARGKRGYVFEFDAVAEAVAQGKTESGFMPLQDSVEVMKIADECRRLNGLEYPREIEGV